jgi:outer membrane protein OmpA-like peptidoglycan-associated protein
MRTFIVALSVAALAAASTTACATKGFVRNRVGEVNDKVESVSKSLEETQERTRKNEAAIADANQKIVQVDQKAAAGNAAASEAAATARTTANRAAEKVAAVEVATKRIVYEVTISEDQGNFTLNQTALPAEARTRIDEMVNQMKATPNGAYIEVAGYTDNTGEKAYNEKLGLERAESVKRYLYQQHQIPLHRISVISYGSEKPVAPNTTRAGRAQNRRVVIRVLE